MKKILFPIFLILLLSGCENSYTENYQQQAQYQEVREQVSESLDSFSIENIQAFNDIELYFTPQTKSFNLIDKIVAKITNAQEKVYLSSYIFTEKRVFEALKKAQTRGIDVRVIMEKNVYKAPFLNNTRYKDLESHGVNVVWSNPENYSLNHTKMLIIDDEAIISTGNYSYSSFAYNREFFVEIGDTDFVILLNNIFLADFAGEKYTTYDSRLVLSPTLTRKKFTTLVSSAKESIKIYSQTFSDDTLEEELISAQNKGIQVEIIFPELDDIVSNTESYNIFYDAGVDIFTMKKPKLHAKALLIDNKYLYLGSINFSYYSIEENREIGVLITNPNIIEKFLGVWETDKKL